VPAPTRARQHGIAWLQRCALRWGHRGGAPVYPRSLPPLQPLARQVHRRGGVGGVGIGADLLRARLERVQPDQVAVLHRHASVWYEEQQLPVEAVTHALAALALAQQWGAMDSMVGGYISLIMVQAVNQEFDRALESIREMKQLYGTKAVLENETLMRILKMANDAGATFGAICAGLLLLARAGHPNRFSPAYRPPSQKMGLRRFNAHTRRPGPETSGHTDLWPRSARHGCRPAQCVPAPSPGCGRRCGQAPAGG